MNESDPSNKYEAALPGDQPEVDYPLEQTIIRRLISKGIGLLPRAEEKPVTPVTDINEFRKKRRKTS